MSVSPYISKKYANVDDFADILGLSDVQFKALTEEDRNRYQRWVTEGNNKVEAELSDLSPDIAIEDNTPEFTFAKNAVLNYALYKKRSKDGSETRKDAKTDFDDDIASLQKILLKNRGIRAKTAAILGRSQKNKNILLPSQLDTAFYGDI